jgi:hypothetical protein
VKITRPSWRSHRRGSRKRRSRGGLPTGKRKRRKNVNVWRLRESAENRRRKRLDKKLVSMPFITLDHCLLRHVLQSGSQLKKPPLPRNGKSKRKLPTHADYEKRSVPRFRRR